MRLKSRLACLTWVSATLGACVTVNVNFPESAVQKATDDYVRDLYRSKEGARPTPSPSGAPSSATFALLSSAWADETESFRLDTPKALEIKEKLRSRVADVLEHKRSGALGETADGRLMIKDKGKLKPLQLKRVEKLVEDENRDRDALYDEVIAANKLPKARRANVERSFSRSFQNESPAGTWIEAEGAWAQKK